MRATAEPDDPQLREHYSKWAGAQEESTAEEWALDCVRTMRYLLIGGDVTTSELLETIDALPGTRDAGLTQAVRHALSSNSWSVVLAKGRQLPVWVLKQMRTVLMGLRRQKEPLPSKSDDSGEEKDESDEETKADECEVVLRRSKRKIKSIVDYHAEQVDSFFENEKGYSHFGRTRKGGDRRPRAVNKVRFYLSLHNIYIY